MSYKDGIFNLSNDREELGKACEQAYKDTSNKIVLGRVREDGETGQRAREQTP